MSRWEYIDNMSRFLRQHILVPDCLVEIRGLKTGDDGIPRSISAFFDNPYKAGKTCWWMMERGFSIYYTLNPIKADSDLGRRVKPNQIAKRGPFEPGVMRPSVSASDADIAYRRYMLVDVDRCVPKAARPRGSGLPPSRWR